ncbi:MAG: hypothetical protein DRG78_20355 [Epsilonproteobacteria bacterium]|nr:MAG: hypothetical protein DRG78_20355 [Campylobacterota bacterium]
MFKLLLLFLPIILFANPSWLYNINPTDRNEIVGYGIDKKLSQAKQDAMSDIVKTISVKIESSLNISKSTSSGKYNKNISTNIKTETKAILTGIKFIKVEQINGLWYVASKYNNSPLEIKIKNLLPNNMQNEKQNKYLKNTELFKNINKEVKTNINYQIIRKDNLWQIKYNDIILPINQDNFYELFSNQKNSNLEIKANQSIYNENDEMYFNISNTKNGYISILYIEHNGKVGLLLSNKKSDKSFTYPDLKSEDTFKIANPYNKPIQELYIALYSKYKIDLSEFENVSDNLLDESNYNFDNLMVLLDKVNYSTFRIKIKK